VTHPLAGLPAPASLLIDPDALIKAYTQREPDVSEPGQRVAFGTSGHRGSAFRGSFNEAHVLAMSQAIAEYRSSHGISGPLFLGKDTHALSAPAERTALSVLAANGVEVVLAADDGYTPTPAISRAILVHNRGRTRALADGIVVTPSHNPPDDGGFKYNPPGGGPADTDVTSWIQDRANALLAGKNQGVRQVAEGQAARAATTHYADLTWTPSIACWTCRRSGARECAVRSIPWGARPCPTGTGSRRAGASTWRSSIVESITVSGS
jgi:phosphoglucomutase